jgi:hypothetical protein
MIETLSSATLSRLTAEQDAATESLRALINARADRGLSDAEDLDCVRAIRRLAVLDFAMKGGRYGTIAPAEREWLATLGVTLRPSP